MVVFGQSGGIPAKVILFGLSTCNRAKWLLSCKNDCIREKVVVFGKQWLYCGKSGCIRKKLLYSGKSGCIPAKVVVFGQKWLYSGKIGCIRTKWLYSGKSGCNRG